MLWGRFRGRRIVAVTGMAGALVLASLGATSHARSDSGSGRHPELGMLVRLHDLQPGFVVDEPTSCGVLDPEGANEPLYEFIVHHFPRVCGAKYRRLYTVPGRRPDPPLVESLVMDVRTAAAVKGAEAVIPELLARLTGNEVPEEVRPSARIGAGTRLFHTRDALVSGHSAPGSLFAWHQGTLFGVMMVSGLPFGAGDRVAARFARLQRAHMRSPVPYPPSARDDLLVPLDNPAIKLPVYWLGREFAVGGGPPLELAEVFAPLGEGQAPPGTRIELSYDALRVGTWSEASWRRYTDSKLGRELLTWHCTKTTTVPLGGGEATIYSGYPKDFTSCPSTPPSAFSAVAKLGGVVLGLNLPICYGCVEGPLSAGQLETAVQGLRLRQPRDLSGR